MYSVFIYVLLMCQRPDTNRGSPDFESNALPLGYRGTPLGAKASSKTSALSNTTDGTAIKILRFFSREKEGAMLMFYLLCTYRMPTSHAWQFANFNVTQAVAIMAFGTSFVRFSDNLSK